MEPKLVFLKASKDHKGDFECSLCGELFRPDPKNPSSLRDTFNDHVRNTHPEAVSKHEDASQMAARILKEATKDAT